MKLQAWAAMLLLGFLGTTGTGCAHVALDDTYGLTYNAIFGAQLADRQAKDTPMRGESCRRIMAGYYEGLAPEGAGTGSPSAAPSQQRSSSPMPTPFKIGAH